MFYTNKNKRLTKARANFGEFSLEEEQEVNELVKLFRGMGFTRSAQISLYIRQNKLGYKFPNISGYLELTRDDAGYSDTWEFEGGIKPRFYREVCERLQIGNNGSSARVTGFESYRQREMVLSQS